MYPYLINIGQFQISSFGILITICFFLFIWMLHKMSKKLDYSIDIFKNNLFWYFISIFFFSRFFYIISKWHDYKTIVNPLHFFITDDYNFSLVGAIFGFFIVFFILLKLRKEKLEQYIYPLVLSFLFILPLGFFGALLGGQVYGIDTNFGIEITYSGNNTNVPYISPIFPLPIFYSVLFFLAFSLLYISNMYFKDKAILGYAGLLIFSCIIFIMEFFSGKNDLLKDFIYLNLAQISVIFIFGFSFYRIYKIYKKEIRRGAK